MEDGDNGVRARLALLEDRDREREREIGALAEQVAYLSGRMSAWPSPMFGFYAFLGVGCIIVSFVVAVLPG